MSSLHPGEILVQARLRVRDEAERVGRIVTTEIPKALGGLLARQRLAVVASLDARERPWASLLSGPAGLIRAVAAQLLHISSRPAEGDPPVANLRARPELGLLVIDLRKRQRMRFNGRGLVTGDSRASWGSRATAFSSFRTIPATTCSAPWQPGRPSAGGASSRRLRNRLPSAGDRSGLDPLGAEEGQGGAAGYPKRLSPPDPS